MIFIDFSVNETVFFINYAKQGWAKDFVQEH